MRKPLPLVEIALFLALLIVAVVGYKFSDALSPKADRSVEPSPGCDLNRQACGAELPGGGRLELSLVPQPIPVARAFALEVALTGMTAQAVEVDFSGVSMNMGLNRKMLSAQGDGRFSAEAILPVCVTGRMAWRATVVVTRVSERIAVPFIFESPVEGD